MRIVTKRKTGSKFLINCLNKLGHAISYDEVSNVETSFAELQANHQSHHSFVPTNLQPSTFVTFVYDNCDHNPETITGVSMHCTNGIIIQNTNINQEQHEIVTTGNPERSRRRSFKPMANEVSHYYSSTNERCNPTTIGNIDLNANQIDETISQKADWMTETDNPNQNVAGWRGFYHKVMEEHLPDTISEVYYLPSINQSPTKMETVQEVLLQVKAKAEALDLTKVDLVLDHAIYCKALEVW